jgi:hypothetical protein
MMNTLFESEYMDYDTSLKEGEHASSYLIIIFSTRASCSSGSSV